MPFNDYSEIVRLLKNSEIHPPFEDIRTMVLSSKRSRKAPVFAFRVFLMVIAPVASFLSLTVAPGTIGLSKFSPTHGHQGSIVANVTSFGEISGNTTAIASASASSIASPFSGKHSFIGNGLSIIAPAFSEKAISIPKIDISITHGIIPDGIMPATRFMPAEIIFPIPSSEPMHPELRLKDVQEIHHLPFTIVLSGAYNPLLPNVQFGDRLLAAGTFRYQFSTNAAAIFELRRNLFVENYIDPLTGNSTTATSNLSSRSPLDVLSVGAGIHMDILQGAAFTPYAEAMVGMCTQGTLVGQSFGLSYALSGPLSIESSIRADELFSSSSTPRTAVSFGVGVGYSW